MRRGKDSDGTELRPIPLMVTVAAMSAATRVFMRDKLRILVIGEQGLLRDGLCALLNTADSKVIGAIPALRAIEELLPPPEPHVVVLDLTAGDDSGRTDLLAEIRKRWSTVRVIMLTEDDFPDSSGVSGSEIVLSKSVRGLQLIEVIRKGPQERRQVASDGLSDREREVMKQIARGYRTREIALNLSLSRKTIEKHRGNLMRKLGLRTAAAVAAYAITNGYVEP
jgi:DNA-binding NarL/FixJ family response regulator